MDGTVKPKGDIRVELADKKNGRLAFRVSCTGGFDKYFFKDAFYVKYDRDVGDVDEGILYVPVVANLAPVARAAGADLPVEALDETFLGALCRI